MTGSSIRAHRKPIVVLDSSFMLGGTLEEDQFDSAEFLKRCARYKHFRRASVIMPQVIQAELSNKLSQFIRDPKTVKALRNLDRIPKAKTESELLNTPMTKFLYEKIAQIGEKRALDLDRKSLSEVDKLFCTSVINYTRYGNVAAATRDILIIDTLGIIYSITRPVFLSQGYADTSLTFIRDSHELRCLIDNYQTMSQRRS